MANNVLLFADIFTPKLTEDKESSHFIVIVDFNQSDISFLDSMAVHSHSSENMGLDHLFKKDYEVHFLKEKAQYPTSP